jgi:hypothetical protein
MTDPAPCKYGSPAHYRTCVARIREIRKVEIGRPWSDVAAQFRPSTRQSTLLKRLTRRPADWIGFLENLAQAFAKLDASQGNLEQKTKSYFYRFLGDNWSDNVPATPIETSVVLGHLATFTRSAPAILTSASKILVFQTGGPKAPSWWREALRQHLVDSADEGWPIEYRVILSIDPDALSENLLSDMEIAGRDFAGAPVDLWIFEQKPQLGIDLMVIDDFYVFLALHADSLADRQCSIHLQDKAVAAALTSWLSKIEPLQRYESWRAASFERIAVRRQ